MLKWLKSILRKNQTKDTNNTRLYSSKAAQTEFLYKDGVFHCTFPGCDYKTPMRHCTVHHALVHTREKVYKCDHCNAEYHSQSAFSYHMTVCKDETKKEVFFCTQCKYSTNKIGFYLRHMRTLHHKEETKQFVCPHKDCSYTTDKSHNLKLHLNTKKHKGK